VTIALEEKRVVLTNHVVRLRRKELELFQALLRQAGEVVSKETLARVVWGLRGPPISSIVETCMSRLRRALGSAASIIETVHGGYRISIEPDEAP
jgi:two-component system OmpR family response regulator